MDHDYRQQLAIVTGANRGIGFEVCRQLARKGLQVMLTSRNIAKGETAVAALKREGLFVFFHELDVTSPVSIDRLYQDVAQQFGRLDILINNAGILIDRSGESSPSSILNADIGIIRKTFETNTIAAILMSQKFVPLMKKNNYGRIVNVSSGMGQLSDMNGGWPAYRLSKLALNGVTKIFADEVKASNILVNSACPGWVRTDMGGAEADRSPEEGADTIVWLAMLGDDGPTGGFFRDRERIPW